MEITSGGGGEARRITPTVERALWYRLVAGNDLPRDLCVEVVGQVRLDRLAEALEIAERPDRS